ncbi:hypothetical protein I7331_03635, partial [Frankia sp. AgB1.8]|nr:hypothetical protein [Frankia sp. AgB1.8]
MISGDFRAEAGQTHIWFCAARNPPGWPAVTRAVTRTPRSGPPAPSPAGSAGTPGSSGLAGLDALAGQAGAAGDELAEQSGGPRDEPAGSGRARRLTSIAAALALVAVGGAAARGRGSPPVALPRWGGGGWLASERLGLLFHVNGPSGQADAAVTLPGAAGHPLTVLTGFARPAAAPSSSATAPDLRAALARLTPSGRRT